MRWREHRFAPRSGTPLCRFEELPDLEGKEFVFGHGAQPCRMFVVRRGNQAWAYLNSCPHFQLPLNPYSDRFMNSDRSAIMCANHYAMFRVEDGACTDGPCEGDRLEPVPIEIRDGVVFIAA